MQLCGEKMEVFVAGSRLYVSLIANWPARIGHFYLLRMIVKLTYAPQREQHNNDMNILLLLGILLIDNFFFSIYQSVFYTIFWF